MASIQSVAEEIDADIYVAALPGTFVHTGRALAVIVADAGDAARSPSLTQRLEADNTGALEKLRGAFEVTDERSYSPDPRFGLAVMAEIASRALSRAVNDAGTAIDVLGRSVRLLAPRVDPDVEQKASEPKCRRVFVPALQTDEMFDDIYAPIARDGAAIAEVQVRLQKSLLALAQIGNAEAAAAALRHSRNALERAEAGLTLKSEKAVVREIAAQIAEIDK